MQTFIRVRDRETGHEYDVDERAYLEDLHVKVNAPKSYPPITGDRVSGRPAKHRTDLAGDPPTSTDGTAPETTEESTS